MIVRRSLWFAALFVSLVLNGGLLWLVQALTFFKTPDKAKDYFPVGLVRLDTPPAVQILKPQIEKPMVPLPVAPKLAPRPAPPLAVKRDTPPVIAPPTIPVAQEIGLEEKAPPVTELASTVPVHETTPGGDVSPGGETNAIAGASAVAFVPIGRLTKIPAFSHRVEPVYPEKERMAGKESSVMAEIDLDEKGLIIEIRLIQSGGKPFDSAVEGALRKSLLTPGYIKDRPVPVRVQIPFVFKLR